MRYPQSIALCCLSLLVALAAGLPAQEPGKTAGKFVAENNNPDNDTKPAPQGEPEEGESSLDVLPPVTPEEATKVQREILLDRDRFIFSEVEFDAPIRGEGKNPAEFDAYNEVLLHARQFPTLELEKAANRDLSYRDLYQESGRDFQFDLVYFEGRLKRLVDIKPNSRLEEMGVKHLYEGWMFPKDGSIPICILVTEKPEELSTSQEYPEAVPIRYAGYFFKLIHYHAREKRDDDPSRNKLMRAPLIIGHSFTIDPTWNQADDDDGDLMLFLGWFGMIGLVTGLAFGLYFYFRTGDLQHKNTMKNMQTNNPFDGNEASENQG